jgi:hypothetical protein
VSWGSLNAVYGTQPRKLGSRFYRLWADIFLLQWENDGSRLQGPILPPTRWERSLTWSEREASDSLLLMLGYESEECEAELQAIFGMKLQLVSRDKFSE